MTAAELLPFCALSTTRVHLAVAADSQQFCFLLDLLIKVKEGCPQPKDSDSRSRCSIRLHHTYFHLTSASGIVKSDTGNPCFEVMWNYRQVALQKLEAGQVNLD